MLATRGYRVHQNPSKPEVVDARQRTGDAGNPEKDPDYLIEGAEGSYVDIYGGENGYYDADGGDGSQWEWEPGDYVDVNFGMQKFFRTEDAALVLNGNHLLLTRVNGVVSKHNLSWWENYGLADATFE
ncbi:hypothetical protein [Micromonospora zhanjiangensis]